MQSRRSFLASASLLAAGNVLGFQPFGMLNALAQTTNDYKALVCVFLLGGNDANNMLVPFDTAGYGNYAHVRGPLAIAQNQLLPLTAQPAFALHSRLPEVQSLFDKGNLAFLANVGTLTQPTTRAQFLARSVASPSNLFSHQDQQLEWQNQMGDRIGNTGWAGRIADRMNTQYNPGATVPMIASLSGDALFCNGNSTSPVALSYTGVGYAGCNDKQYCGSRQQTSQQLSSLSSGVTLIQEDNAITSNAFKYNTVLQDAFNSAAPLHTSFSTAGTFGLQLEQVAKLIQVRAALGIKRQIFFVGVGDFDTHGNQVGIQASLLGTLSSGLGAFYQALEELNISQQVTTFTCSDFSRSLQPNSASGSDHAWGSHHMILGGAVKGGKIYGTFPTLALGGPDDSGSNGRWIPTTGSAQYAATLAQWFGLNPVDLPYVLPYIGNFGSNNLGFV